MQKRLVDRALDLADVFLLVTKPPELESASAVDVGEFSDVPVIDAEVGFDEL